MYSYLCVVVIVASPLLQIWTIDFVGCQNAEVTSNGESESNDCSYESGDEYSNQEETNNEEINKAQQPEFKNSPGRAIQNKDGNTDDRGANEKRKELSDYKSTPSIVNDVIGKADSLIVFFDKIFQKADNKVSALNEQISNMRTRLPGVAYGGSLMTVYYTMIPIFRNTKDVMNKVLRVGNNALKWLRGKPSKRNNFFGRNYRYWWRGGSAPYRKFSNYYYGSARRPSKFTNQKRRFKIRD